MPSASDWDEPAVVGGEPAARYHKAGIELQEAAGRAAEGKAHGLLCGLEVSPLGNRKISVETCEKFGYAVGFDRGRPVQVASLRDRDGHVVAQHVRGAGKTFSWKGDPNAALPLWGQWLWRDGGKMVVVCEGELDAMSVSQVQGNKWPVVSVPNGAQSAVKYVKRALDWLSGFDTVIFMFDADEPGQNAARECALLFPPGKAKLASLPLKDASEMLVAGRGGEIIDAIWGAKTYRPDGILAGEAVLAEVRSSRNVQSVPYPWIGLNAKTHGMRRGEITTWTAGSGVGKTAFCREVAYHLRMQGERVGYIALEESVRRTALGLMGLHMNSPLHLDLRQWDELSEEEKEKRGAAFDAVIGEDGVFLYDHFGSLDIDNLMDRVRYLARACDCPWIILDHLSIVVSGLGDGDERRLIDNAMTRLRSLVEETGVGLHLVSHLKRPSGDRGHEDGAETHLSQLRGSAAIAQLSDMVIGLERDQQGDDPNTTVARVLKNRFSGDTGPACSLRYDRTTGRLSEVDEKAAGDWDDQPPFETGDVPSDF